MGSKMNVLLVMPAQGGVSADRELLGILQGQLQVRVLSGMVDRQKLSLALANEQYDAVHFAQHGARLLLELGDGALTATELVSMLRRQKAMRFVVLNSCDSIATGIEIHNALMVPTVAMNAPIDDAAAVRFAEAFYGEVRAGSTIMAAVEAGRAVLARLFPQQTATPQLINGSSATIDDLMSRLNTCTGDMKADMNAMREQLADAFQHLDRRTDKIELLVGELSTTVAGLRDISGVHIRRAAQGVLVLLALLVIAQALTPILNSVLIHLR